MLEPISALFYVIGREIFVTMFFCFIFIKYLKIPRIIYYSLVAANIFFGWLYFCNTGYDLNFKWQYVCSIFDILIGILLFKHEFNKKFFLIALLCNYGFLTQTFTLVMMEQVKIITSTIVFGAITINMVNILAYPFIIKVLKNIKDTILNSHENSVLNISSLILLISLMATMLIYDFHSPRDWKLLWGRSCNILQAFIFIYIIFHLLKEKELHNELNSKMEYIEKLRHANKNYIAFIIESWKETRRLRHDIHHVALLLKEYLNSSQYQKLKTELIILNKKTGGNP